MVNQDHNYYYAYSPLLSIIDVKSLLLNEYILDEFPLRIVSGEIAYDTDGVCRDMFSAFWDEAYKKFFDSIIAS